MTCSFTFFVDNVLNLIAVCWIGRWFYLHLCTNPLQVDNIKMS